MLQRCFFGLVVAVFAACPASAEEPLRFDAATDARDFCSLAQTALTNEDFGVLEATAERARSLKNRFPGSKTELQVFYESFEKESCYHRYSPLNEALAKGRIALAERWLGAKPESLTAKIANALIWRSFAWVARGDGFANEVSPNQWATFSERLKHAAEFMRTVDPDRDAEAYLVLLNLARDFNLPRPQIDTIFRRAHARFPSYIEYYPEYASILLPKWFGQPGEIADYTKSLLIDPGGDDGAMAYSRVAERLAFEMASSDIYRDAGLTWDDVRHGFALRESRDGLDKHAWIALCYYAVTAGDRTAARDAYSRISELDLWPVGGTKQFFRDVLPWIMQRD